MVVTMVSMVAVALLVALLLTSTLHTGTNSDTGISNAPGVAQADSLQAQQALSTGLSTANAAAANEGGYGGITPTALSAAEPSVTFVAGPSSGPSVVSVAVGPGAGAGFGNGSTGSITLAARSADGTCWLVWKSGDATWYGAQTHLSSCSAPVITSAPVAGAVSSTAIGWQEGTFPAV